MLNWTVQNSIINLISTPDPEIIKLFSCSIHLSMKLIMLINVKMPTIVGIFKQDKFIIREFESKGSLFFCVLVFMSS